MKNDAKIEVGLTFQFKIDEEFDEFWPEPSIKNLKNLHFNGLLLTKVYVWAKKV